PRPAVLSYRVKTFLTRYMGSLRHQGFDEAPDAYDRLAQQRLVGREAHPHESTRLLAERSAIEHRYPLGPVQLLHEVVARKTRAAHVDQQKHSGVRDEALEPANAAEPGQQKIA